MTEPVGPADRGATVVADRVVAKIAAQAAREAVGTLPEDGRAPHASVTVRQGAARVRVSLDLPYPTPIGDRCAAVRQRVAERVRTLAGMTVPEVSVLVERLHSPYTRGTVGRRTR
ncbi:Asp23/Gls24 family envelope stress response protein [Streptomyces sp. NPDC000594]|uniref:Asp23/Gls24 family envelope stress response protein n=1 Tax=Streptomyces sp. NPDC000594 TaxID=3154261 RepID=UPI00331F551F